MFVIGFASGTNRLYTDRSFMDGFLSQKHLEMILAKKSVTYKYSPRQNIIV